MFMPVHGIYLFSLYPLISIADLSRNMSDYLQNQEV